MNKDLCFECVEEFADYIIGRVEDNEDIFITMVGKFETIKPLLREIMSYEFVDFENIEIEGEIVDNYADEFILSVWMNDSVIEVGCEKLKRDGEYISPCGDETYLMEDCSSKIIPLCEDSNLYFVSFDEECDCDGCDGYCSRACCEGGMSVECSKGKDGDIHGFTASRSDDNGRCNFLYHTSDELSERDVYSILKAFGFF